MKLSKFQHIEENQFKTGYEIETCLYRAGFNDFSAQLKKLDKRINIGTDGSIRPLGWVKHDRYGKVIGDIGREIRTPVLKSKEGIQLLAEIFNLVNQYGYQNETTGFHFNFSPQLKDYEKLNPFFLAEQPIWKRIKQEFNRDGNKYCTDVVLRKDIRKNPANVLKLSVSKEGTDPNGIFWDGFRGQEASIHYKHKNAISLWHFLNQMNDFKKFGAQKPIKNHWHYSSANFSNYYPEYSPQGRAEIRSFGGADYCSKLGKILPYIDETIALAKESFEHTIKI
jgi:hypothetical protein